MLIVVDIESVVGHISLGRFAARQELPKSLWGICISWKAIAQANDGYGLGFDIIHGIVSSRE